MSDDTIAPVAHDEELADRMRAPLGGEVDLIEKKMFGGLAFLIAGNMAVAASGQGEYWFAWTQLGRTRSSPRRTHASWRCAAGGCEGGCESTRMMCGPIGRSRDG
jgi:hypothetical protein